MPRKKLTPKEAKAMLIADGMDFEQDFHALGSSAVQRLADVAKLAGYRKSKNAPGSTVRMFYQYLSRVEPVVRAAGQLTSAERRAYQARARDKKKTPAQLDREINEALSSSPTVTRASHATMKTTGTTDFDDDVRWAEARRREIAQEKEAALRRFMRLPPVKGRGIAP